MKESIPPNESIEKSYKQKVVEALPQEQQERVKALGSSLEATLAQYLLRPNSDPQVLDRVHNLIAPLSHSLMFGDSSESLNETRKEEVMAGLAGAGAVLDVSREVRPPSVEADSEEAKELEHFLVLAEKRVKHSIKLRKVESL